MNRRTVAVAAVLAACCTPIFVGFSCAPDRGEQHAPRPARPASTSSQHPWGDPPAPFIVEQKPFTPPSKATPSATLPPQSSVPAPKAKVSPHPVIYIVQSGDTLSAISWTIHVPVADLYAWNRIVIGPWPDLLLPGQPLIIGK